MRSLLNICFLLHSCLYFVIYKTIILLKNYQCTKYDNIYDSKFVFWDSLVKTLNRKENHNAILSDFVYVEAALRV